MPKLPLVLSAILLSSSLAFASKIVSVGGSITETIVALGHQDKLIGVDQSSAYPKEVLKDLPNVGYWLQLPKEGILSLKPDIVITSDSAKPKELIDSLPKYGIKTYLIEDKPSIDSAKKKIMQIAEALNEEEKAKEIIARIGKNINKINSELKTINKKPKVLFMFSRAKGLMMAAGQETRAGKMIELSGGENLIKLNQYTKLSEEAIIEMNPDVIIFSNHGRSKTEISPALKSTNAGKNKNIHKMDILLMSGFTVRLDEALSKLTCMVNDNKLSHCK